MRRTRRKYKKKSFNKRKKSCGCGIKLPNIFSIFNKTKKRKQRKQRKLTGG